jgi:hypothetical protein
MERLVPLPAPSEGDDEVIQVERSELARLLAAGLRELGYSRSALVLEEESQVRATSAPCDDLLRSLQGFHFDQALACLNQVKFKVSFRCYYYAGVSCRRIHLH